MRNALEDIAQTLKEARQRKGLSQRVLAELADVPQSHISKIENGGVDLRLSSLVEIGRALDLEVTLVPRKTVPAIQSIVRNASGSASLSFSGTGALTGASAASRQLARLQKNIRTALANHPEVKEIAQLQRQVRELGRFQITLQDSDVLHDVNRTIKTFDESSESTEAIRKAVALIKRYRNSLVHNVPAVEKVKPAYSLEDDDG